MEPRGTKAEEGIFGNEQHFRTLFEALPDAVYTCDAEGRITLFNHRAVELWGRAPSIGDSAELFCGAFRLYLPDGTPLPHAKTPMARALREGRGFRNVEVIMERPDGSCVHVLVNPDPIRDSEGRVIGAVNAFTDITDRKRIEEDLRGAKEEAERATRAKDEFIATLSHELRTPLTPALITASSIEKNEALTADLRQQIGVIRRNVELEARLIDDLLDVTRVLDGRFPLHPESIDLHQLLRNAVEMVQDAITTRELTLQTDYTAQNTTTNGDPVRLQQVFWSLLSNAIKFTPSQGHITVRTFNPNPTIFAIEVLDTGVGISSEAIDRIFHPFKPGGGHRRGGLGVGLAIAKAIVDSHHGVITVKSAGFERGATFSVTLPIRPLATDRTGATAIPDNPTPAASPHLHILLVEDNEPTRRALVRILTHDGHCVRSAATLADALHTAHTLPGSEQLEVLISDIGLPDGTGLALVHELKAEKPGLTAIAISGYGTDMDIRKSIDAGFDVHLIKPIRIEDLRRCLAA